MINPLLSLSEQFNFMLDKLDFIQNSELGSLDTAKTLAFWQKLFPCH